MSTFQQSRKVPMKPINPAYQYRAAPIPSISSADEDDMVEKHPWNDYIDERMGTREDQIYDLLKAASVENTDVTVQSEYPHDTVIGTVTVDGFKQSIRIPSNESYVIETGRFCSKDGTVHTESSENDSWYRLYSNNWVEQGGYIDGQKFGTIKLFKFYSDVEFQVDGMAHDTDDNNLIQIAFNSIGIDTIEYCHGTSDYVWTNKSFTTPFSWESKGFINKFAIYAIVTFDANGGIGDSSKAVESKTLLGELPRNPTRDDEYVFTGWYTAKEGGTQVTSATPINRNVTFYAHWVAVEPCVVTYDANGGTVDRKSETVKYGDTIVEPPTPIRENYEFNGWWTEKDGGELLTSSTKITSDITFYAHWGLKKYNISYDMNGHDEGKPDGLKYNFTIEDEFDITPDALPVKGHKFLGWNPSRIYKGTHEDQTVIAKWDINSYTITWNSNGGTDVAPWYNREYHTKLGDLPTSTYIGHTFVGWFTDISDDKGVMISEDTLVEGDTQYYAHWKPNKHTVTYYDSEAGGAIYNEYTKVVTYGSEITFPNATKEGYSLEGWYHNGIKAADKVTITEDIDYHARWNINHYTVNYDGNGGSPGTISEDVAYQHSVTLPSATWSGRTFIGWFTERGEGTKIGDAGAKVAISENTTFYAHWTLNKYTITYDANGGECGKTSEEGYYGQTITLPSATKPGYTFEGWYSHDGTKQEETITVMGTETYTANWNINLYTVRFFAFSTDEVWLSKTYNYQDELGELPTPTKTGYTFKGWWTRPGAGEKIDEKTVVNGDIDYYAHWEVNKYTITYEGNGGTPDEESHTYDYGTEVTLAGATRTGWTFNGWFTLDVGGEKVPDVVTIERNATYYAHWTINQYTVTFDANGGDCDKTSETVDYGTTVSLPSASRTGYEFTCWKADDGTEYRDTITVEDSITLRAQWEANTYTVTFHYAADSDEIDTKEVNYDDTIGELPSTEGHEPSWGTAEFDGWYTSWDETEEREEVTDTTVVHGDMDVYGCWNMSVTWMKSTKIGKAGKTADISQTVEDNVISNQAATSANITKETMNFGNEFTIVMSGVVNENWAGAEEDLFGAVQSSYNIEFGVTTRVVYDNTTRQCFQWEVPSGLTITVGYSDIIPVAGNKYWWKYVSDGVRTITGYISEDGITWVKDMEAKGSLTNYNAQMLFGNDWDVPTGTQVWNGTIDLKDAYVITKGFKYKFEYDETAIITITLDSNGGTLMQISDSYLIEKNSTLGITTMPYAEAVNYTFEGWYSDITGGYPITVSTLFGNSMSIYAHWTDGSGDVQPIEPKSYLTYDTATRNITGYTALAETDIVDRYALGTADVASGISVFSNCTALTSISLPNATSIGSNSFLNCQGLKSIDFPKVTYLGSHVFESCDALTSVEFPNVTKTGGYVFVWDDALVSVKFPKLTSMGAYIFRGCTGLTHIDGTETSGVYTPLLTMWAAGAFSKCSGITTVTVPNNITTLDNNWLFSECTHLESVIIGSQVKVIGTNCFASSGTQSATGELVVNLPDTITTIKDTAFNGCTTLKTIHLSTSLTTLGTTSFNNCTALTSITFNGTKDQWNSKSILTTYFGTADDSGNLTGGSYTASTPIVTFNS